MPSSSFDAASEISVLRVYLGLRRSHECAFTCAVSFFSFFSEVLKQESSSV